MNLRLALTLLMLTFGDLRAEIPELDLPADLAPERRALVELSLRELAAHPNVPYRYAAASPEEGMDCSGAIYYLLRLAGCEPPRSSAAQYEWVKAAGNLTAVPPDGRSLDHPAFAKLRPGDLVFWAPDGPDSAAHPQVTHVQIYLGREKRDGFPVMIG
ncbi:MAG TPA: NlpC/P60 family protein, partial [Chthoniobacterales bacterium]